MRKKIRIIGLFALLVSVCMSCEKKEGDSIDYGQSFTFEYEDNTPVVGAEVELKVMNLYGQTFATGTTDENGTVYFSKETLDLQEAGFDMPYDFVIYAKKGVYSNIQNVAIYDQYAGEVNQNRKYPIKYSLAEVFMTPKRWNFADSYHMDTLITESLSECSKDNYLETAISQDPNNNFGLIFVGNEGDLLCDPELNFNPSLSFNILNSGMTEVEIGDVNSLPSASIRGFSTYQVSEIKLTNDTLYFISDGATYKSAYVPVY